MFESLYVINGSLGLSNLFDLTGSFNKMLSEQSYFIQQGLFSIPTIYWTELEAIWSRMVIFAIIFLVVQVWLYVWKVIFWFHTRNESLAVFFTKLLVVLWLVYWFAIVNDFLSSVLIGKPSSIEVSSKPWDAFSIRTIYPWTAIQIMPRSEKEYTFEDSIKVKLNSWEETNSIPEGTLFPKDFISLDWVKYKVPIPYEGKYIKKNVGCSITNNSDGSVSVTPPEKQSIDYCLIDSKDVTSLEELYTKETQMKGGWNTATVWFPIKVVQTLLQSYSKNERYSYAMVGTNYEKIFNDKCTLNVPNSLYTYIKNIQPFSTNENILEYNQTNLTTLKAKWEELSKNEQSSDCYSNDIQLLLLLQANNILNSLEGKITETINGKESDTSLDRACFETDDDGNKSLKKVCLDQKNACSRLLTPSVSHNAEDFKRCFVNDLTNTTNVLTKETTDYWKFAVGMEKVQDFDFKKLQGLAIPVPLGMDWWAAVDPDTQKVTGEKNIFNWIWEWVWATIGTAVWWVVRWIVIFTTWWVSIPLIAIFAISSAIVWWGLWFLTSKGVLMLLTDTSKTLKEMQYKKMNREPLLASVYSYDLDGSKDSWSTGKYENSISTLSEYDTYTFDVDEFKVGNLSLYDIQSPCWFRLKWIPWETKFSELSSDYWVDISKINLWWADITTTTLNDLCPSLQNTEITAPSSDWDKKIFKRDLFSYEVWFIANPRFNPTFTYGVSDGWWDKFSQNNLSSNSTTHPLNYSQSSYRCVKSYKAWNNMVQDSDKYCQFWDFSRITDVRLQPYNTSSDGKDLSNYIWDAKLEVERNFYNSIIAHVSIPITMYDGGQHNYTADRYNQIFAKEAVPSMPWVAVPKGIKVQEWDVFAVKPWSIIGTDSTAFKVIYDKRLEPWVQTIDLLSGEPIADRNSSTLYGNWLFSKFNDFLMDLGIWSTKFKEVKVNWETNWEQTADAYAKDVYASRPDQVKEYEGNPVAWILDPFLGFWYTNSWKMNFVIVWWLFAGFTRIILIIIWLILFTVWLVASLRMFLMQLILVVSPFLFVFLIGNPFLSEWQTKKIFVKTFQLYFAMILFSFLLLIWFLISKWLFAGLVSWSSKEIAYLMYLWLSLLIACWPALYITWKVITKNWLLGGLEFAYDYTNDKLNSVWTDWYGANSHYGEQIKNMKEWAVNKLGEEISKKVLDPISNKAIESGKKIIWKAKDSAKKEFFSWVAWINKLNKTNNIEVKTLEDLASLTDEELTEVLYSKNNKTLWDVITNKLWKSYKDKKELLNFISSLGTGEDRIKKLLELNNKEITGLSSLIKEEQYFDSMWNLLTKEKVVKDGKEAIVLTAFDWKKIEEKDLYKEGGRKELFYVDKFWNSVSEFDYNRMKLQQEEINFSKDVLQKNKKMLESVWIKVEAWEKIYKDLVTGSEIKESVLKRLNGEVELNKVLRTIWNENYLNFFKEAINKDWLIDSNNTSQVGLLKGLVSQHYNLKEDSVNHTKKMQELFDPKSNKFDLNRDSSLLSPYKIGLQNYNSVSKFLEENSKDLIEKVSVGEKEFLDFLDNVISKKDKDLAKNLITKYINYWNGKSTEEDKNELEKYLELAQKTKLATSSEIKDFIDWNESALENVSLEWVKKNYLLHNVDEIKKSVEKNPWFTYWIDKRIYDAVRAYISIEESKKWNLNRIDYFKSQDQNPLIQQLLNNLKRNQSFSKWELEQLKQLKTGTPEGNAFIKKIESLEAELKEARLNQNHLNLNMMMRDGNLHKEFLAEIRKIWNEESSFLIKQKMLDNYKKVELDYYKEGGDLTYYLAYPGALESLRKEKPELYLTIKSKVENFKREEFLKNRDRTETILQFQGLTQNITEQSRNVLNNIVNEQVNSIQNILKQVNKNNTELTQEMRKSLEIWNKLEVKNFERGIYTLQAKGSNEVSEVSSNQLNYLIRQVMQQQVIWQQNISNNWWSKLFQDNISTQIALNERRKSQSKVSTYLNENTDN